MIFRQLMVMLLCTATCRAGELLSDAEGAGSFPHDRHDAMQTAPLPQPAGGGLSGGSAVLGRIDLQWSVGGAWDWGFPGPKLCDSQFNGRNTASFLINSFRNGETMHKVSLGTWRYTAVFADVLAVDGARVVLRHRGNIGAYFLGDWRLWSEGAGARTVDVYGRYGKAVSRLDRFSDYTGFGLVATGWIAPRPKDGIGLGLALPRSGMPYRMAQALRNTPALARECAVELSYHTQAASGLVLQPTLQYVVSPGPDPSTRNALTIGLRFEAVFGREF